MERLTEKVFAFNGTSCMQIKDCDNDTCDQTCRSRTGSEGCEGCPIQIAIDKLSEYEDLEEQRKLLKLPCVAGDTVYYADNEYYFTVLPVKVDEISIMESNAILYKCLLFDGNGGVETQFDFDKDDFGKTVFLTHQEAEDKLAEMEGKK